MSGRGLHNAEPRDDVLKRDTEVIMRGPDSFIDPLLEKFANKRPVAVMARITLERIFEPAGIDRLFRDNATVQYEKQLKFADVERLFDGERHRLVILVRRWRW